MTSKYHASQKGKIALYKARIKYESKSDFKIIKSECNRRHRLGIKSGDVYFKKLCRMFNI